jgi:hypothetical protein
MNLYTDIHHQYALDRQQRLRDEAAAHRLAASPPPRARLAHLLHRTADRLETAVCGRPGCIAAEHS